MPTYRFRVKYEHDPTSLWRDIVVGTDRTLDAFQSVVNYPALLALTRSLRAGLARRVVGWDSSARSRLLAQGQTPAAI